MKQVIKLFTLSTLSLTAGFAITLLSLSLLAGFDGANAPGGQSVGGAPMADGGRPTSAGQGKVSASDSVKGSNNGSGQGGKGRGDGTGTWGSKNKSQRGGK